MLAVENWHGGQGEIQALQWKDVDFEQRHYLY